MGRRNEFDGHCNVCGVPVNAGEGAMVYEPDSPHAGRRGYLILCVEHSPDGVFEPPQPPEASKLPSIHRGEEKYER